MDNHIQIIRSGASATYWDREFAGYSPKMTRQRIRRGRPPNARRRVCTGLRAGGKRIRTAGPTSESAQRGTGPDVAKVT
jgi:hypothetical protein